MRASRASSSRCVLDVLGDLDPVDAELAGVVELDLGVPRGAPGVFL